MNLEDMKKLAVMARIDMGIDELSAMAHDFDSILGYVDKIKEFSALFSGESNLAEVPVLYNVMREDSVLNTPGEYTERILSAMPDVEKGYLKVKQIL
jgi:aspartyl/glutamyl-tRNA(Asn/Gln) amidotransferase C subunit